MQQDNSILFQAKVLSVDDPLMLGRVRAVRIIDNYNDIIKGITDPPWNFFTDPWSERDPFVFVPLLPYFLNITPKFDELITILYLNKDYRYQNQYYVQSNFSSPTATYQEYYEGGNKLTGTGTQYKNSLPLKNKVDGTYTDNGIHYGVFPESGDNGFLGRGSADMVVKQDEVLIRAGKFKEKTLQPNVIPVANEKRAFVQLSRFQEFKKPLPDKTVFELRENVILVKYLIEWVLTNPENTKNNFTGKVMLYQLKPNSSTNSKNLTVDSFIDENLKILVYETDLNGGIDDVVKEINDFIKICNKKNFYKGFKLFPDNKNDTKFPIFYRPNNFTYSFLNPSSAIGKSADPNAVKNISEIYKRIKLTPSIVGGNGLIYTEGKVGIPKEPVKKVIPQSEFITQPITFGVLGGEKIFLLSQISAKPGKSPINFDNTLYGIQSETFSDEIIPKTSSMVRGEELLELINMIVRFLVSHTHAFPGLPPVRRTQDGSSTEKLLTELQNAANKILNNNIRLN
jgi:hypothetical protein